MNKRIEELSDQCYYINTYSDKEIFDHKKFAELIVRECINQVQKDENGPAYEAAGRIARHFRKGE